MEQRAEKDKKSHKMDGAAPHKQTTTGLGQRMDIKSPNAT
jgi:hypothetical protein